MLQSSVKFLEIDFEGDDLFGIHRKIVNAGGGVRFLSIAFAEHGKPYSMELTRRIRLNSRTW